MLSKDNLSKYNSITLCIQVKNKVYGQENSMAVM